MPGTFLGRGTDQVRAYTMIGSNVLFSLIVFRSRVCRHEQHQRKVPGIMHFLIELDHLVFCIVWINDILDVLQTLVMRAYTMIGSNVLFSLIVFRSRVCRHEQHQSQRLCLLAKKEHSILSWYRLSPGLYLDPERSQASCTSLFCRHEQHQSQRLCQCSSSTTRTCFANSQFLPAPRDRTATSCSNSCGDTCDRNALGFHSLRTSVLKRRIVPGFVGMNNIKANDYVNVVAQLLAHVLPIRNFFQTLERKTISEKRTFDPIMV
jgi:hypothetical protein